MPALLTRRRWRTYPYQRADINWNSDFARGLCFLTLPGSPFNRRDLVLGSAPTLSGYGTTSTPFGDASSMTTGSGNGLNYGNYNAIPVNSSTYTIGSFAKPTSTASITAVFGQYDQAQSNNPQIELCMNGNQAASSSAGKFSLVEYSAGYQACAESVSSMVDANWHVFMGRRNGAASNTSVWRDGVNQTSSVQGTSLTTSATGQPVYACGQSSRSWAANYPVLCVSAWNYSLNDDQVREYSWLMDNRPDAFLLIPSRRAVFDFGATVGAVADYQYIHPTSDIVANGWLPSSGSDLYAMVDEVEPVDLDYIYSPSDPTTQQFELKFPDIPDPLVDTGHAVIYRLTANKDTNFDFDLVEGTTVLDSWTENVLASAGVVQRTHTFSEAVIASITDRSNVRIRGKARA